jgi:lysophospholipase L1-like esterase
MEQAVYGNRMTGRWTRWLLFLSAKVIVCFLLIACSENSGKWVALGDSITYLNDHNDETGDRVSKGYLTRVAEKVPGLDYVNKGYNGWTAVRVAEEIENLGLEPAGVYTVFLGTNDWWQGKPLGTIRDYEQGTGTGTFFGAYRIIIDKIRSLNTGAGIVLITPMQRGDFVYINDYQNQAYGSYRQKNEQSLSMFADAVVDIGEKEQFPVVDLYHESGMTVENSVKFKRLKDPASPVLTDYPYPSYIDIPFDASNDPYPYPPEAIDMTYDGLHPSDKGNEIIASMVAPLLKDLSTR